MNLTKTEKIAIIVIALLGYGFFGIIHCDAVGVSAKAGNFLAHSGTTCLILAGLVFALSFIFEGKKGA